MGRQGSEQTGRPLVRSPGRPGINQLDTKRAFWNCIAQPWRPKLPRWHVACQTFRTKMVS
jgi:hypothetical protein